jgi:hypothetical protein
LPQIVSGGVGSVPLLITMRRTESGETSTLLGNGELMRKLSPDGILLAVGVGLALLTFVLAAIIGRLAR